MSGPRILRRFPFALKLGTDICHVIRIRKILESSRGTRFVQRILNEEERGHPLIRCILDDRPSIREAKVLGSHYQTINHHTGVTAAHGKISSPLRTGPSFEELRLAATFMAGRYDHPSSSEQHLTFDFTYLSKAKSQLTEMESLGSPQRRPSSKPTRREISPGMVSPYHIRPRRMRTERVPLRLSFEVPMRTTRL